MLPEIERSSLLYWTLNYNEKSFICRFVPGGTCFKTFLQTYFMNVRKKLECLSLSGYYSLV
jgi:hypothetical protein